MATPLILADEGLKTAQREARAFAQRMLDEFGVDCALALTKDGDYTSVVTDDCVESQERAGYVSKAMMLKGVGGLILAVGPAIALALCIEAIQSQTALIEEFDKMSDDDIKNYIPEK